MEHLDKLLGLIESEFDTITKNGKFRSREEIDSVGKLVDMVKDIYCIDDMENGDYYSENDGTSYRSGNGYSYGNSYASGGNRQRRDSRGRYSSEGGRSSYRMGYSRHDGREDFAQGLRDMMRDAPDEKTRMEIQRMIDNMSQA